MSDLEHAITAAVAADEDSEKRHRREHAWATVHGWDGEEEDGHILRSYIEALEAEVERLERYLFAARASITTLESELKAISASCDAYAEEVGRLAHKLAALAGGGDGDGA